jgi:uncharacterized protein YoxC
MSVDGVQVTASRIVVSGMNYGNISAHVPFLLADGMHEVQVILVDQSANVVSKQWTFTVDSTPPKLELSTPANVGFAKSDKITIAGSTEKGAKVTINGEYVAVDTEGRFNQTEELKEGLNVFEVEATDEAGNREEIRVTALYLPELNMIWENITKIYGEIGNISGEVRNLEGQVNNMEEQITELKEELRELKEELGENVTMLERAIKENNTELMKIVNDNITKINDDVQDIEYNEIPKLKSSVEEEKSRNSEQDGAIVINSVVGVAGLIIALVAIVLTVLNMRKKRPQTLDELPKKKRWRL